MDNAPALRFNVLVVLVSLPVGGVVTTAFLVGGGLWALGYTADLGDVV